MNKKNTLFVLFFVRKTWKEMSGEKRTYFIFNIAIIITSMYIKKREKMASLFIILSVRVSFCMLNNKEQAERKKAMKEQYWRTWVFRSVYQIQERVVVQIYVLLGIFQVIPQNLNASMNIWAQARRNAVKLGEAQKSQCRTLENFENKQSV